MTDMPDNPAEPEEPETEYSIHSGWHSHNSIQVEVHIFRIAGTDDPWMLEVTNRFGGSTIWKDTFPTDERAYSEFLATLAKEGIEQF